MIRIKSYKELSNSRRIYDYYLYLLVYILPFWPGDFMGEEEIEVNGEIISAQNFYFISKKKPRKRTDQYVKLLKEYLECDVLAENNDDRFKEDWLLAAKLIKAASTDLFSFLYEINSEKELKIRREQLRKLFFARMDCLDERLVHLKITDEKSSNLLLEHVFRYREFAASRYVTLILEEMDVKVCPYCNCQYTSTVNKKKKKIRPQLDHYKCKSLYPHFAVTLLNLVPSCPSCNQRKADKTNEILYPYSDEMGINYLFRTKSNTGVRYLLGEEDAREEFELELVPSNPFQLNPKAKESIEVFQLNEVYIAYKDYILLLFRKHYIYNKVYLETLYSIFEGLFQDEQKMKEMFYVMDIDPSKWGDRPLSKLTHDIDQEIKELLSYSKLTIPKLTSE